MNKICFVGLMSVVSFAIFCSDRSQGVVKSFTENAYEKDAPLARLTYHNDGKISVSPNEKNKIFLNPDTKIPNFVDTKQKSPFVLWVQSVGPDKCFNVTKTVQEGANRNKDTKNILQYNRYGTESRVQIWHRDQADHSQRIAIAAASQSGLKGCTVKVDGISKKGHEITGVWVGHDKLLPVFIFRPQDLALLTQEMERLQDPSAQGKNLVAVINPDDNEKRVVLRIDQIVITENVAASSDKGQGRQQPKQKQQPKPVGENKSPEQKGEKQPSTVGGGIQNPSDNNKPVPKPSFLSALWKNHSKLILGGGGVLAAVTFLAWYLKG